LDTDTHQKPGKGCNFGNFFHRSPRLGAKAASLVPSSCTIENRYRITQVESFNLPSYRPEARKRTLL
jgi:hypothetical protein